MSLDQPLLGGFPNLHNSMDIFVYSSSHLT